MHNVKRLLAMLILATCLGVAAAEPFHPHTDAKNTGNWVLNQDVSDEFEGREIDEEKWYIVGKFEDGKPVYRDPDKPKRKVWKGRAPSQFSGRNYRLEDGKLMLETRWEPNFPFSAADPQGGKYGNITTACFIGRRMFKYGYMEIRSKAADAEVTSSFWATGSHTELDMFEMFGDHRQPKKLAKDKELWWSIHDWSRQMKGKSVYTEHHNLGFRVADAFHTYGIEWSEAGIKYYVDGKLVTEATAAQIDAYAKAKVEAFEVPEELNSAAAAEVLSEAKRQAALVATTEALAPYLGAIDSPMIADAAKSAAIAVTAADEAVEAA
ncbi:MAG: family 16 glycosylhydrolase, partial [Victivallales bacterium]|nr:family 16 glycosylhydrolase [Victivallales bacterium]